MLKVEKNEVSKLSAVGVPDLEKVMTYGPIRPVLVVSVGTWPLFMYQYRAWYEPPLL
jgi:hypothetical protein